MYTGYTKLLIKKWDKLLIIKFNNPTKKNCLSPETYAEIARALRTVAKDDSVSIVAFTGVGDFFSAGNDLSVTGSNEDFETRVNKNNTILKEMLSALIDCPKITIALVNGPAVGIGTTLAGLCDLVWCAEHAYFLTPFTKLGLCPEACSSYLLPHIVGRSRATEMLLFSEKMSSKEAYDCNFVSRVFAFSDLDSVIWPKIKEFSELPPESMLASKALMQMHDKASLYKALDAECDELLRRFSCEEFLNALIAFSTRKTKSKL